MFSILLWHDCNIQAFPEETEEEEFLYFSTKVNVDWTVKPQILKRSKGFTKKAGSIIFINL